MTSRHVVLAVLLLAAPGGASAEEAAADEAGLTLPLEGVAERTRVAYECRAGADAAPEPLEVEYVNLPGNTLAILPVDGRPTLFVNVIAASGAKYVAGPHVWWTKGPRGDLMDERIADPAKAVVCRVSG